MIGSRSDAAVATDLLANMENIGFNLTDRNKDTYSKEEGKVQMKLRSAGKSDGESTKDLREGGIVSRKSWF